MWAHVTEIGDGSISFGVPHQYSDIQVKHEDLDIQFDGISEGDNVILERNGRTRTVTRNELLDAIQADSSSITQYEDEVLEIIKSDDEDTNAGLALAEYLSSPDFDVTALENSPNILLGLAITENTFKGSRSGTMDDVGMDVLTNYIELYREEDDVPNIPVENVIQAIINSINNGNNDRAAIGKLLTESAHAYSKKYPFRTDYDETLLESDESITEIIENGYAHREIDKGSIMGDILLKHPEKFPQTITEIVNAIGSSPNGVQLAEFLVELHNEQPDHAPSIEVISEAIRSLKCDYTIDTEKLHALISQVDDSFDAETAKVRSKKDIADNIALLRDIEPGETRINLDEQQLGSNYSELDEVFLRLGALSEEYPEAVGAQLNGLLQFHNETRQPIQIGRIIWNLASVNPKDASEHTDVLMDIIEQSISGEYDAKSFKPACRAMQVIASEQPDACAEHVERLYELGTTLEDHNKNISNGRWPESRAEPYDELEVIILNVAEHDRNRVRQAIGTEPKSPLFGQKSKNDSEKSGGLFSSITNRFS